MKTDGLKSGDRLLYRSVTRITKGSNKREAIFLREDKNDPNRAVIELVSPDPKEPRRKSVRKMFIEPCPAKELAP